MTSSKNAVSLLAAAALVVTPAGNLVSSYQTAHAEELDGDASYEQSGSAGALPKSYGELMARMSGGESFSLGDLEIMKANGVFESESQYAALRAQLAGNTTGMAEMAVNDRPVEVPEGEAAADNNGNAQAEGAVDQTAGVPAANGDTGDGTTGAAGDATGEVAGSEAAEGDAAGEGTLGDTVAGNETPGGIVGENGEADGEGATGTEAGEGALGPGADAGEQAPVVDGINTVAMPGFQGKTLDDLKAELIAMGVPSGAISVALETSELPEGTMLRTNPAEGSVLLLNDPALTVTITVATAEAGHVGPADAVPGQDAAVNEDLSAGQIADITEGLNVVLGETPAEAQIGPVDPVDPNGPNLSSLEQMPTQSATVGALIRGEAQTPLKQVAVQVPNISFTHMDNSAYVARHYTEDLTTEKFISLVGESARSIAADNDLYASVMIAQAILESASGNSTLAQAPNNNLFGIKGNYKGQSVELPTREDDGRGATYRIMASFRQYDTVEASLSDYADLLSNSMGDFYAGARKSNTDTFVDACDFLVGRYATDIFYSEKLQDLIETYDLTRFDVPLTYEMAESFVLPVRDEATGADVYLDPVLDQAAYQALVAEYNAYLERTSDYQAQLADWQAQMQAAEEMYHVPVYLEKPSTPDADTARLRHRNDIDARRFEGFDELIAAGAPLPVREERTLDDLATLATSFLGVPYLWGGTTPSGFDCSGLVQYCYREVFNIELPRTTYYQCEIGVEVPFEELLPGDLLFFDDGGDVHHVGIYLGDGYYVEAPHTGSAVKITAMSQYMPDFAKRVVESRDIDMSEFSDEQLAQFVQREKYLQEREMRLGTRDENLRQLSEWLQGLTF